jgi:adenylate cyclase
MSKSRVSESRIQAISDWLIAQALGEVRIESVFTAFCQHLGTAGVPLLRGHLAVRALHPLFTSMTTTWWRGGKVSVERFGPGSEGSAQWRQSPLLDMLENRIRVVRHNLEVPGDWSRFPLLVDLREAGATDYFVLMTPFGDEVTAHERMDGIICSWVTDRPGGFSAEHIRVLRRLQFRLAVAIKVAKREQTAANVVAAYLGADAGARVLEGRIHRGEGEFVNAVLWYCDLRGSTELADRLSATRFLALLDSYFECTAGAVVAYGGNVVDFVGDAVLAMFPIGEATGAVGAARKALAAMRDAAGRMAAVNGERSALGEPPLHYGLGLHVGRVLYGNIGIPERIEFTVIGRAVNEVVRLEALTKEIGGSVVVSSAFVELAPLAWRSCGRHHLRGVSGEIEVYAPPEAFAGD